MAGVTGFGTAIGIHPVVGYNSVSHLAPAVTAAIIFLIGLALCFGPMTSGTPDRVDSAISTADESETR